MWVRLATSLPRLPEDWPSTHPTSNHPCEDHAWSLLSICFLPFHPPPTPLHTNPFLSGQGHGPHRVRLGDKVVQKVGCEKTRGHLKAPNPLRIPGAVCGGACSVMRVCRPSPSPFPIQPLRHGFQTRKESCADQNRCQNVTGAAGAMPTLLSHIPV